jgi:outer membrane protein assembly factor BamB
VEREPSRVRPTQPSGETSRVTAGRSPIRAGRILWEFREAAPDCSTPLFYQGRLYVFDGLRGGRVVTCLDPKTGTQFWQGKLGGRGPWWASLTAGDGKLYCISEAGEAVVLRAGGDTFEVLSRTEMGGSPTQSSIAIANGHLFIRTADNLYCVGE